LNAALRNAWRWWDRQFGLLTCPIIATIVSIVLFHSLRRFGFVFRPNVVDRLFAAKLTFLSFSLAAGFIQYSYFFQMRWSDGQKIRAGEWPHIKKTRQMLERAQASERTDATFLEWIASLERFLQEEPERYLQALADHNRPTFAMALSLAYAIGGACFVSATADLVWLLAPEDLVWLRYASSASIIAAFAMLAAALVLGFLKLRVELIKFFDY